MITVSVKTRSEGSEEVPKNGTAVPLVSPVAVGVGVGTAAIVIVIVVGFFHLVMVCLCIL